MRIACPYCGERDLHEFICRGEAEGVRPDATHPDALSRFIAYVYGRANTMGEVRELWYHAAGCRGWLVVARDTRNHAIRAVVRAAPEVSSEAHAGTEADG